MKPYLYDGVYIKSPSKELCDKFTFYIPDYKGNFVTYKLYSYNKKTGVAKFPYGALNYIEDYEDRTINIPLSIKLTNKIELRPDQEEVVNQFSTPSGILYSQPGSGKTVMGCELISRANVTTLILVPTVYLLNQWKERIETFLGVTPGILGDKQVDIKEITVSTFPSALNNLDTIKEKFSLVIVDETHRIAADTYRKLVHNLPARYKFGMTGTLERKDKLDFMIYAYLGKKVVKNDYNPSLTPEVVVISLPIRLKGKNYVEALNYISMNEEILRHQAHWLKELYNKRYQLGLSLRVAHIHNLRNMLAEYNVKLISGATPTSERDNLNKEIEMSRLILATNVLDEGADITNLDTLHLLSPTNNIPKLIQRINRVTRYKENKKIPLIFDYWFLGNQGNWNIRNQQRARLEFYKEQGYKIYAR